MVLPLFVPVIMSGLGLFGIGKTAKATMDNGKADELVRDAALVASNAEYALTKDKLKCNGILRKYGEMKIRSLETDVAEFVSIFGKIKNVFLQHSPELDRLHVGEFTEVTLENMRYACSFAKSLATSSASGVAAGALTAYGAYGGTMLLASAGTGTAIGTLSGVAATNATMAWLGGGTLASGGLGMAGGTMVLGVLVAGPALLVLGSVLGEKASKKLNEARATFEEAQTYEKQTELVRQKLNAIIDVTHFATELLTVLCKKMKLASAALSNVVDMSGDNYLNYSDEQKSIVFQSVKYAQLMKTMIDAPVLNQDGSLVENAMKHFASYGEVINFDASGHSL